MADIGFIGLGNMGGPMALNLVKAGHKVRGFDVVKSAIETAVAGGIEAVDTAADAAEGVDAVITMLPAGSHVRETYTGAGKVIAAAEPGTLMIDSSTIDVASARAVVKAAEDAGHMMIDAPVSGGIAGAAAGSLTFMAGGTEEAFARARPILEGMGRNLIHAGGAGNGQVAKVCNNMVLAISMIGLAEAFTMAEKLGLEAQTMFDIVSKSSGSCWALLNHPPVAGLVETSAASNDFKPGFSAAMMLKDLRLSQEAAVQAGTASPMGAEAAALYTLFVNAGNAGLDYSAIVKLIGAKP